jgi:hypothetical protein
MTSPGQPTSSVADVDFSLVAHCYRLLGQPTLETVIAQAEACGAGFRDDPNSAGILRGPVPVPEMDHPGTALTPPGHAVYKASPLA